MGNSLKTSGDSSSAGTKDHVGDLEEQSMQENVSIFRWQTSLGREEGRKHIGQTIGKQTNDKESNWFL